MRNEMAMTFKQCAVTETVFFNGGNERTEMKMSDSNIDLKTVKYESTVCVAFF